MDASTTGTVKGPTKPFKSKATGNMVKPSNPAKTSRIDAATNVSADPSAFKFKEEAELAYEQWLTENRRAARNPEGQTSDKKYEKVRGETTPMPPRGDKRREEFEKWYAKQR